MGDIEMGLPYCRVSDPAGRLDRSPASVVDPVAGLIR